MVKKTIEASIPAQGTANGTGSTVLGKAPVGGIVRSVSFIPNAAVTAHATNYRTFTLQNKGQAGAGTTAVATFATDTPTTDDLTASDEKALPLSGTPANLRVVTGDVLTLVETVAASGVAHGGGRVIVEIGRN